MMKKIMFLLFTTFPSFLGISCGKSDYNFPATEIFCDDHDALCITTISSSTSYTLVFPRNAIFPTEKQTLRGFVVQEDHLEEISLSETPIGGTTGNRITGMISSSLLRSFHPGTLRIYLKYQKDDTEETNYLLFSVLLQS